MISRRNATLSRCCNQPVTPTAASAIAPTPIAALFIPHHFHVSGQASRRSYLYQSELRKNSRSHWSQPVLRSRTTSYDSTGGNQLRLDWRLSPRRIVSSKSGTPAIGGPTLHCIATNQRLRSLRLKGFNSQIELRVHGLVPCH